VKRRLTFNGLRGVISQKTEQFITTAVRTANLQVSVVPVLRYCDVRLFTRANNSSDVMDTASVPTQPLAVPQGFRL
jgi:hypothetical protein